MKKTLLSVAGSVAFAAALALVGCSAPTTVNYDTIESIGAPNVTAKTYAGVVRLTWNVVQGAQSYEIYKDGVYQGVVTDCVYNDVADASNNLVNGVKYTYDVVAVPKSNYAQQQRAVYIKGNQTSVTVEAKVPSPEDFKAEYESYFAKFTAEGSEFKTELATGEDYTNYIMVTAPTLPEFGYEIKTYVGGIPAPFDSGNSFVEDGDNKAETDDVAAFTFTENDAAKVYFKPVLGKGDIKTSVKVIPVSPLYQTTTFETDTLHIYGLETTNPTRDQNAWYVSDTKVHLEWTPADLNGVYYDPADYSVFGYLNGVYTKVDGEIKVLNPGDVAKDANGGTYVVTKTTYYIEDTVVKGDARKEYFLTLYKEYNYENWWSGLPFVFQNTDDWPYVYDFTASYFSDGKTVRVSFTPVSETDSPSMYTVYRTNTNDDSVVKIGDVKAGTYTTISGGKIITEDRFYVDDIVPDTTVDYTYKLYRRINGELKEAYWDAAWADSSAETAGGYVYAYPTTADEDGIANDVSVTIMIYDKNDNFTLYRAKSTESGNDVVDTDFVEVKRDKISYNETYNQFEVLDKDLPAGYYVYKVVVSGKGKKSSSYATTWNPVTVD